MIRDRAQVDRFNNKIDLAENRSVQRSLACSATLFTRKRNVFAQTRPLDESKSCGATSKRVQVSH
jgi:hypothetical protein